MALCLFRVAQHAARIRHVLLINSYDWAAVPYRLNKTRGGVQLPRCKNLVDWALEIQCHGDF